LEQLSCHEPCPSSKQANNRSIAALKRCAHDFRDQQVTCGDGAGISYLESADNYEYNTLAIGKVIAD
jgi:hypothetical protein